MAKIEFVCPKCEKSNIIVIMGNDLGKFTRTCKTCDSELEIEINENKKDTRVILASDIGKRDDKLAETVPDDYRKYEGEKIPGIDSKTGTSPEKRKVAIIAALILSASLMGIFTSLSIYQLSDNDSYERYDDVTIDIRIEDDNNAINFTKGRDIYIFIDEKLIRKDNMTNVSITLKPGIHQFDVGTKGYKNSTAEIFIAPQDSELGQQIEGINLFTFILVTGDGTAERERETAQDAYFSIFKYCPISMLIFSIIGIWGSWVTYSLQSYKNAQIGAFFSVLAMGFLVIGPILGIIALVLLPKIKNMFNRSL